jgi:hypothetical protein
MWANLIFQKPTTTKRGENKKQAKKEKRFRNVLDMQFEYNIYFLNVCLGVS